MAEEGRMKLDPPVERLLQQLRSFGSRPIRAEDIPAMRERISLAFTSRDSLVEGVRTEDGVAGGIPVRLYRPTEASETVLPLHVYFHGGGFMFGSAFSSMEGGILSERALAANCVVASVEYRLAPEHRFPAGVEDAYAALVGLAHDASTLEVDPDRITVGGASSGGNFAAVVALMSRDRGGPALRLQLLEMAGTDLTKSSSAWRYPVYGHDTTREHDLSGVDLYLNSVEERAHPYASPLFAADLRGVAPAYIMNAEFDPRRDECEAYAARLQDAGVPAAARTMHGHIHASAGLSKEEWMPAQAWRDEANDVLAEVNRGATTHRRSGDPCRLRTAHLYPTNAP
jgi:acetyl esterase